MADRRFAFIVATHVSIHHHGHTLFLVVSGIRQQHGFFAHVVVVDNDSAVRLSASHFPSTSDGWFSMRLRLIANRPSTLREWGAYHVGLLHLVGWAGEWNWNHFDQFVFLQGGVVLTEPVPSLQQDTCSIRPLGNLNAGALRGADVKWLIHKMRDVGDANAMFKYHRKVLGCAHTSFTALPRAVRVLHNHSLLKVDTSIASLARSEHFAGHLAQAVGMLLASEASSDLHCDLSIRWAHGAYCDQLHAGMISAAGHKMLEKQRKRWARKLQPACPSGHPVGYWKLHGSRGGMLIDMSVAGLMRMADTAPPDGLLSHAEVAHAVRLARTAKPLSTAAAAARMWRTACTAAAAVVATNESVRAFVRNGPANTTTLNMTGSTLAALLLRERTVERTRYGCISATSIPEDELERPRRLRERQRQRRRERRGALHWAEEAYAMLVSMPLQLTQERVGPMELTLPSATLLGPMLSKLRDHEPLWGGLLTSWAFEWGAEYDAQDGAAVVPTAGCEDDLEDGDDAWWQQEAVEDATELIHAWDDDGDGLASFDEIRRSLSRTDATLGALLPICMRADVLGSAATRSAMGLLVGTPKCNATLVRSANFGARVRLLDAVGLSPIQEWRWYRDWNIIPEPFVTSADFLVPHIASLLFARLSTVVLERSGGEVDLRKCIEARDCDAADGFQADAHLGHGTTDRRRSRPLSSLDLERRASRL